MKYLFLSIFLSITVFAQAQFGGEREQSSNALLNQSFWRNNPGVDAVKAEIAKGNNPSEMNRMSMDPVVVAINAGAPNEAVIYLLQQPGNDVNKLTHDSRTYLFWAASKGNLEIVKFLISKGAKVNVQDSHGISVLNFAAMAGQQNTAMYDLFLQNGANLKTDVTSDGANALLLAVGSDTTFKLVEYFQTKGLDLKSKDAEGNNAFYYAAKAGNIKTMKMLLSKGISVSENAMLAAAQGGRRTGNSIEVFQYLESVGAKPTAVSKNGENALHSIVRRPAQTDIIKYFLSKGVNVNQENNEGNTAFMNAVITNRDTAVLALLLPLTKDINHANTAGATALALAVRSNSAGIVTYLINNGANVNTTDAKGNNLVYYLFEGYDQRQSSDFEPKLKALQSKGLDVAAPQKDGNTLYHLAVGKNNLSLLKLIQSYRVDVNAKNKEGLTALHKAAMISGDDKMMQYLVSIGAKKDSKTGFNETAYELAHENELLSKNNVSVDFLK